MPEGGGASIPVSVEMVMGMVARGLILCGETEFNELAVGVDSSKIAWQASCVLTEGSHDVVAHISLASLHKHPKLTLMMWLTRNGWIASQERLKGSTYTGDDDDRIFDAELSRPKNYFLALARSDMILKRLAIREDVIPAIYHGMSDSYYAAMLHAKTMAQVDRLLNLLEGAQSVTEIKDKDFSDFVRQHCNVKEHARVHGWVCYLGRATAYHSARPPMRPPVCPIARLRAHPPGRPSAHPLARPMAPLSARPRARLPASRIAQQLGFALRPPPVPARMPARPTQRRRRRSSERTRTSGCSRCSSLVTRPCSPPIAPGSTGLRGRS